MSNLNNYNEVISNGENSLGYGANRCYKDSLFRLLFGREENKQNLLDLYNALNDSDYTNKDDLIINTIDDVIYMKMKNDVSFILDSQMVLLEHQSTYNPNMPLRGLLYFARLYEGIVNISKNIYYPRLIKIPTPKYIVLYNGTDRKIGNKKVLRLSDAYEKQSQSKDYEWTATMIDINYGENKELLLKCKKLGEYSYFVESVRRHYSINKNFPVAIDEAVKECIDKGILADFLRKHIAEVRTVLLTEFNEERDYRIVAEGLAENIVEERSEELIKEGLKKGINGLIDILKELGFTPEQISNKIQQKFNISCEEANKYISESMNH